MNTTPKHADFKVGKAMAKKLDAWLDNDAARPAARPVLRGLALAIFLLSACDSGADGAVGTLAAEPVPAPAGSTANVERLGLMRIEAADVSTHADWAAWFSTPWRAGEAR